MIPVATVLVIDSSAASRVRYAMSLDAYPSRAVEPYFAKSASSALSVLHAHPELDAVIVDADLPDMSLQEFVEAVHADAAFVDLPLIAQDTYLDPSGKGPWGTGGVLAWLPKPPTRTQVHAAMDTAFRRARAAAAC